MSLDLAEFRRLEKLAGNNVSGRLVVSGGVQLAYAAKTANYTIVATTDSCINCTSGSFTVTLPTAVGLDGQAFVVKNSGTGAITIATTSSQTIDGATTATMSTQYESISLISNGANWIIT